MPIFISWSIFRNGGTKFVLPETSLHTSTFHRLSQGGILWKENPMGIPRMFFALPTGVIPPIYDPNICFKVMALTENQGRLRFAF